MKKIILFLFTILTVFSSCNNYMDDEKVSDEYITFKTDGFLEATTRGATITAANMTSFGVSAAVYPAANSYTTAACGQYFHDIEVSAESGTCGYFWPGSDYRMAFYAYAPYGDDALTVGSAETTGHPIYSYTVPTAIASQLDFVTASVTNNPGTKTETPVALSFSHKCAALRFHITNDNTTAITITSVGVYGVKYAGTYKEDRTPKWVLTGSANTTESHPFLLTLNTSLEAGADSEITGTSNQFILLPQTVAAGTDNFILQTIEDGIAYSYTYTLPSNMTVEQGTSFTYNIVIKDKKMYVDPDTNVSDWDTTNASGSGSVSNWWYTDAQYLWTVTDWNNNGSSNSGNSIENWEEN